MSLLIRLKTNNHYQIINFTIIRFLSSKSLPPSSTTSSAWRSSLGKQSQHPEKTEKYSRQELLKRFAFGEQEYFSHIKEETLIYEISNPSIYRAYFITIIANFLFWIVCAEILLNFYTKISEQKEIQKRKRQYEEHKYEMTYMDRAKEFFKLFGIKDISKWLFTGIGTGSSLLFLYLLSRCVSSIRLMPGGREIKVCLVNWTGSVKNKRPMIFPLKDVIAKGHRLDRSNYLTMKVKGHKSIFLIDQQGRFPEEVLFDMTVGLKRHFKQN